MILAGDVGGTKIHLALYEEGSGDGASAPPSATSPAARLAEVRLETAATPDLAGAIASFADGVADSPRVAVLGIAGPVSRGRVQGTNLPWEEVGAESMSERLGGVPVVLINDLVASAHGLADVDDDALLTIQAGEEIASENRALLSPGTGLGECLVAGRGQALTAIGTEGGHGDFAPADEEQVELWRWLRARYARPMWEHVISGPGFANVHAWLVSTARFAGDPLESLDSEDPSAPARITGAALEGSSPLCGEVVRLWMAVFGAEAGNVALLGTPRGGLYLGGGIPGRLVDLLRSGPFLEAFRAKPPDCDLLESIPVKVVTDPDLALRGAARYALDHVT